MKGPFTGSTLTDERANRTHRAIVDAFSMLVAERGYESLRVSQIVEQAQISRSTFYKHFQGKEDLLKRVVEDLFVILAGSVSGRSSPRELREALEHIWQQKLIVRVLMHGTTVQHLTRLLTASIHDQLQREYENNVHTHATKLRAIQAAGSQVALIRAWVSGEIPSALRPVLDSFLDMR